MGQTASSKGFVMLPRFLLGMHLSDTTKLIYALLLDRSRLSLERDEFKTEDGRAFVFYTADQLAADIGRTSRTVLKSLAALEDEGLIERQRQGLGFASRIFVLTPHCDEENTEQLSEAEQNTEPPEAEEFFSPDEGKNFPPDTKNIHFKTGNIFTSRHENNSLQDMKSFHANNNKNNNTKKSYNKKSYTERERGSPRGHYKIVFLTDEEFVQNRAKNL